MVELSDGDDNHGQVQIFHGELTSGRRCSSLHAHHQVYIGASGTRDILIIKRDHYTSFLGEQETSESYVNCEPSLPLGRVIKVVLSIVCDNQIVLGSRPIAEYHWLVRPKSLQILDMADCF